MKYVTGLQLHPINILYIEFFNLANCYKYLVYDDTRRTLDEARAKCTGEGGHLVSIKSSQELEVIKGKYI